VNVSRTEPPEVMTEITAPTRLIVDLSPVDAERAALPATASEAKVRREANRRLERHFWETGQ